MIWLTVIILLASLILGYSLYEDSKSGLSKKILLSYQEELTNPHQKQDHLINANLIKENNHQIQLTLSAIDLSESFNNGDLPILWHILLKKSAKPIFQANQNQLLGPVQDILIEDLDTQRQFSFDNENSLESDLNNNGSFYQALVEGFNRKYRQSTKCFLAYIFLLATYLYIMAVGININMWILLGLLILTISALILTKPFQHLIKIRFQTNEVFEKNDHFLGVSEKGTYKELIPHEKVINLHQGFLDNIASKILLTGDISLLLSINKEIQNIQIILPKEAMVFSYPEQKNLEQDFSNEGAFFHYLSLIHKRPYFFKHPRFYLILTMLIIIITFYININ